MREFYVFGFPSQNSARRKIKGKGKIIFICGINLNTPLKTCTSFSVRFKLIPIRIKWEEVFST